MLNTVNPLLRTDLPLSFDAYFARSRCGRRMRIYYYIYARDLPRKIVHFWTYYKESSKLSEDLAIRCLFGRANHYLDSILKS